MTADDDTGYPRKQSPFMDDWILRSTDFNAVHEPTAGQTGRNRYNRMKTGETGRTNGRNRL
ncbi:hypothetical protein BO223_11025 [Faecalibaculum rodentium]|uniref:Uncharacterized protein n=2 Tax=Faecalibaculum rodentium TaxID=1702221 RepID=A0A1Q9YHN6_9FIRM|nr:hypothetical protein BO223_11025 [Faecalibaculum rodentium]